ncbi:DUF4129 domain-containing protein [Halorussus salinisoli]|uniref:DUF4129 domain-containing protein n=1 Tax=Halorussus salinisoli TaxID=2558242 RepID=UPI0010C19F20|nr:DUF4129 domain-containing protein [Halorussus salinisoli]
MTAKQNGNETRARKLARELEQLQTQINRSETNLTQSYESIANNTGSNLTTVQRSISNSSQNISTQQADIRRTEFTQTTITIDQATTNISFRDPLNVTGRLTSANGTALENRTIAIKLGPRTVLTNTTTNGSFTVSARPTLISRGTQTISLRYLPANTSAYLSSTTAITVNVTAVTPTVTLTHFPSQSQYNQTVTIAGQVDVASIGVGEEVPLRVTLGSTIVGTTKTTAAGTFTLNATIPASLQAGSQELQVTVPLEDRALARTTTTESISVTETATHLSVTTLQESANQVQFQGELRTVAGEPIANQTLRVEAANQTLATVTTNKSGAYATVLNTSNTTALSSDQSVNVNVTYSGAGNLKQAHAATQIETGAGESPWNSLPVSPLVFGGSLLGIGVIGALVLRSLTQSSPRTTAEDTDTDQEHTSSVASETHPSERTMAVGESLLEQATTHLEDGEYNNAVQMAYRAVRQQLTEQTNTVAEPTAQTHWEFYREYQNPQDSTLVRLSELESLTEAFEQARFTPSSLSSEQATTAVKIATSIVSPTDTDDESGVEPTE